jgi:hypothetical protein
MNIVQDKFYYDLIENSRYADKTRDAMLRVIRTMKTEFYDGEVTIHFIIFAPDLFLDALRKYVSGTKGKLGNATISSVTQEQFPKTILMLINLSSELRNANQKIYDKWLEIQRIIREPRKIHEIEGNPNARQMSEYVPLAKLIELRDALPDDSREKWLLTLYTDLPPARPKDYYDLPLTCSQIDGNSYRIDTGEIYLKEYKTAKIYKTIIHKVPLRMHRAVCEAYNANNQRVLFAGFKTVEQYQLWARNALRKLTGNNSICLKTLRNIYLTDKIDNIPNSEKRSLASSMGHSVDQQKKYVWNIK